MKYEKFLLIALHFCLMTHASNDSLSQQIISNLLLVGGVLITHGGLEQN